MRYVRTPDGERRFNKPIGSPIVSNGGDTPPDVMPLDRLIRGTNLSHTDPRLSIYMRDELGTVKEPTVRATPYGTIVSEVDLTEEQLQGVEDDLATVVQALPSDMPRTIDVLIPKDDDIFDKGQAVGYVVGDQDLIHLHPAVARGDSMESILIEQALLRGIPLTMINQAKAKSLTLEDHPTRLAVMMHESGHVVDMYHNHTHGSPTMASVHWQLAMNVEGMDAAWYAAKNPPEGYAEFYAEYRLSPDPSASARHYAQIYGWDDTTVTGSKRARITGLWNEDQRSVMDELRDLYIKKVAEIIESVESKATRRVRDAAFWGMPVGTPIEPGMKPAPKPGKTPTRRIKPKGRSSSSGSSTSSPTVKPVKPTDKPKSKHPQPGDPLPPVVALPNQDPNDPKSDKITEKDSIYQHLEHDGNGRYRIKAERAKFYQDIADAVIADKPKGQEDPVYTMLGGGGGSGKSVMQQQAPGITPEDVTVKVDPDELKGMIFDRDQSYQDMGMDKDARAGFLHEESSAVAKLIQTQSLDNGQDFMLDGTGNSSPESLQKKIDEARAAGHTVNGVYATVPTQLAWARNVRRGERDPNRGRVAAMHLNKAHTSVSEIVPEMAGEFDDFELYDMSDSKEGARLIARCKRGGEIEVLDQETYDGFLSKAGGWSDEELEALTDLLPEEYLAEEDNQKAEQILQEKMPELFQYGWKPSMSTKADKPGAGNGESNEDESLDIMTRMMRCIIIGTAFEDGGWPDTPAMRAQWQKLQESRDQIPKGTMVALPAEWPDDKWGEILKNSGL